MTAPIPLKERLTAAAAAAFLLSVGVVSTASSKESVSMLVLVISAIAFVTLYASD